MIRAKSIAPEYLYLYLTSDIAYRINAAMTSQLEERIDVRICKLGEFPIVMPKRPIEEYKREFERIANPDQRFFDKICEQASQNSIAEILKKENWDKIRLNNRILLEKHIVSDMEELKVCFENKAYKATAILAGAFLEAFLIDWLSEIDGKKYFEESLIVEYVDSDGNKREKDADFVDFIRFIKENYKPKWNSYAKKANIIRDIRNNVHIKKCLSRTETIDENVCRDILNKLESIINSRNELQ